MIHIDTINVTHKFICKNGDNNNDAIFKYILDIIWLTTTALMQFKFNFCVSTIMYL